MGTITYRSGPEWELRFNRKRRNPDETPSFCPDYEIEYYLDRQVPNISTTHSYFDLFTNRERSSVKATLILILGCTSLKSVTLAMYSKHVITLNFTTTYIQAMDMFDMSLGFSSLSESLSRIKCPILVSTFYKVFILCYLLDLFYSY